MIQDLQPTTYIMLFIFAGLAVVGLFTIGFALYIAVQRVFDRKPTPDERRWARDWENIEREINK